MHARVAVDVATRSQPRHSRARAAWLVLIGALALTGSPSAQERPGSTLPYAEAAALMPPSSRDEPCWTVSLGEGRGGTQLTLPRGQRVTLVGEWTRRSSMWPDTALVFREDAKSMWVLDGGSDAARLVWEYPHRAWSRLSGSCWSRDGSTLFAWLDIDQQLSALDVDTGAIRPLTELDSHIRNYKGDEHLDPRPVDRPGGVIEDADNGLLLFLLDEESNEEVAPWQRRSGRGGVWLAALDLEDGNLQALCDKSALPPVIFSWDLSLDRQRLYTLAKPHRPYQPDEPRLLEERRFNGELVRSFAEPEGGAESLELSPDQSRLLVERRFKPGLPTPSLPLDDYERSDFDQLRAAEHGGFVVLDLDSGALTEGPRAGCEARWAPDGNHVVYADGWSVRLGSLAERRSITLICGAAKERDWYWQTWYDFAWSPDGKRLAMTSGNGKLTLLLDLDLKEYLVLHHDAQFATWAPVPQPFAGR